MPALKESLNSLGLDYLDLYLIHWPIGLKAGDIPFPKDEFGHLLYSDVHFLETWQALEKCVDAGLVKSIGKVIVLRTAKLHVLQLPYSRKVTHQRISMS